MPNFLAAISSNPSNGTVSSQPTADYIEADVCTVTEIGENEMKQFEIGDTSKVLVVKQNGVISALGPKCSHSGALLSLGALSNGRIRCPSHGACFNIRTGDIEDFPGIDSIPCYKVTIANGNVRVRAKRSELQTNRRIKAMVQRDMTNATTYLIIGAGPSGGVCAETLRQEGFTGRIILAGKEMALPYDRCKCSKAMDLPLSKLEFRSKDFYTKHDIDVLIGHEAFKVDTATKTVDFRRIDDDQIERVKYDKLYIATGSRAQKPPIRGVDLKNVVTVRDYSDSAFIMEQISPEKHVVCVGLSFTGLETAAYLSNKVAKVTVIGRDSVPFRHSFGPEIGQRITQLFEANGVEMRMQTTIKRCIDSDGVLSGVELSDGTEIKCDICIMGTGSTLNTEFLQGSGVSVNENGSIDTTAFLETNVPGVYVGGDIANAPVYSIDNQLATIGHYPLAHYHGFVAAKNMADNRTELKAVPYFWTMLFGKSFRYAGYGMAHETRIIGSLEDLKFVAIFLNENGYVCGMASCQRDPIVSQFAELQSQGKTLHKLQLDLTANEEPFAWAEGIKPNESVKNVGNLE